MQKKVIIINGPNLNLLGKREPEIYGNVSFESYLITLGEEFKDIDFQYFQSNLEGEIIDVLQKASALYNGIIFNGAGYTHTSVAIADCLAAVTIPVVEVHISNIHARESFRQQSLTAKYTKGVVTGFGLSGYALACYYLQKNMH